MALETIRELEKRGYLDREVRLFHLRDQVGGDFQYHYHDFHKIIFFLSGKVTYHIEGTAYELTPGDILLVDRYAVHQPEIDSSLPYERYILWIQGEIEENCLLQCFRKVAEENFHLFRIRDRRKERLLSMLQEMEGAKDHRSFGSDILVKSLFQQFMVYLNRAIEEKDYIYDLNSFVRDPQIQKVRRYINQNLTGELTVDLLAEKHYLSKAHLMRRFKAETGYTIHNYIVSKRLAYARMLLQQGMPVVKVSEECGFGDYSTFVRAYKKQFLELPSRKKETFAN